MAQQLEGGMEFVRNGKLHHISQLRLQHGKIEIQSDDGDLAIISTDAFRREMVDGCIQEIVRDDAGVAKPVSTNWMELESECSRAERNRREKILSYVNDELKRGIKLTLIVNELKAYCTEQHLGHAPSERTLRNWRKRARGHHSMLSPAWNLCGNRRQGPDEMLLSCIREAVLNTIARSDKFRLSRVWGITEALYRKKWEQEMGDIPMPPHGILKLQNFVQAMPWNERNRLQLDGRTARAVNRTAVSRNTTDVLWQVVEMDATVLDVFVRDEEGHEIGRPVLYVAIDVATVLTIAQN